MTRTGKIARLPQAIREERNRRITDGEPGGSQLPWRDRLPPVRSVWERQFGGQEIAALRPRDHCVARLEFERERLDFAREKAGLTVLAQFPETTHRAASPDGLAPNDRFADESERWLEEIFGLASDPGMAGAAEALESNPVAPGRTEKSSREPGRNGGVGCAKMDIAGYRQKSEMLASAPKILHDGADRVRFGTARVRFGTDKCRLGRFERGVQPGQTNFFAMGLMRRKSIRMVLFARSITQRPTAHCYLGDTLPGDYRVMLAFRGINRRATELRGRWLVFGPRSPAQKKLSVCQGEASDGTCAGVAFARKHANPVSKGDL